MSSTELRTSRPCDANAWRDDCLATGGSSTRPASDTANVAGPCAATADPYRTITPPSDPKRPESAYHEPSALDARHRIIAFFGEHLSVV